MTTTLTSGGSAGPENVKVISKLKRHYMGADAPNMSKRLKELELMLDNQILQYRNAAAIRMFNKGDMEAMHKLVLITKELEQANTREHEKLEKALETMSPEELAIAEQQALELLSGPATGPLLGPGTGPGTGGVLDGTPVALETRKSARLTYDEFKRNHESAVVALEIERGDRSKPKL